MRQVDGDALSRTTMCPREFGCLENNDQSHCAGKARTEAGIVLEKAKCPCCPYLRAGGDSEVCTCPTRAQLHKRYQM